MKRKIELSKIICAFLVIVAMLAILCTNFVYAESETNTEESETNNKFSFLFDFGTGVSNNGILTIKWNIKTNGTVNYSSIIAIAGTLQYDKYAFENPTIQGENGFTATFNSENEKFVLDASSFKEGQQIATITLKAKQIPYEYNCEIGLSDVQIARGKDDKEINKSYLKIGTAKVPADIYVNDDNNNNITNNVIAENTDTNSNIISDTNSNIILDTNSNGETIVNANTTIINQDKYIEPIKDTTTSNKPIPQTGMKITIFVVLGVEILIGIITFIRYKKFYD